MRRATRPIAAVHQTGMCHSRVFIEFPQISRADILLDLVQKGEYPGGRNSRYTRRTWRLDAGYVVEGLEVVVWRWVVECFGLGGGFWW